MNELEERAFLVKKQCSSLRNTNQTAGLFARWYIEPADILQNG